MWNSINSKFICDLSLLVSPFYELIDGRISSLVTVNTRMVAPMADGRTLTNSRQLTRPVEVKLRGRLAPGAYHKHGDALGCRREVAAR
jgi:hypothetical protein